ncbi:MAG: deoxyguanosinetriphosphate triphosphohydrolase [Desulfovibrio sp.]|nr:deoxyguanosinetriphosphate triphosphohydrolase [Desulfovibrio sp.]
MERAYRTQWAQLLAPKRRTADGIRLDSMDSVRTPFLADHDRIVFSSSFRRLGRKTQVHPLVRNDHIHNRLTHSLEVSCVGRSLGLCVGEELRREGHLPEGFTPEHVGQILQAACLAHDIGNPPFGHAGEEAIRDWFAEASKGPYFRELSPACVADFVCFDGNAQGFRVINALENNKDRGGLRLTFPVIASLVKYPCSAYEAQGRGRCKFNFYTAERDLFTQIFATLGLTDGAKWVRHPLSWLLEAADDICYRIIDMEDARELGIINYEDFTQVMASLLSDEERDEPRLQAMDSDRRRAGMLRTVAMGRIIPSVARTFKERYAQIMSGDLEGSLLEHAHDDVAGFMQAAAAVFHKKIMNDAQKTALEIGTYALYRRLLDVFIPACFHHVHNVAMSYQETRAITLMGANAPMPQEDTYGAYLRVLDFVAGMTDEYATFLSRQFSGTTER